MQRTGVFLLAFFLAGCQQQPSYFGTVEEVVDGDTVRVRKFDGGEVKVRMVNIDAPETSYMERAQEPSGTLAKEELRALLPEGSPVDLEVADPPLDAYGRTLGMLYRNGENVNLLMVRGGWAVMYLYYPAMGMAEEFAAAQSEALRMERGIFAGVFDVPEVPYEWRRTVSGREPVLWAGNLRTKRYRPPENIPEYPLHERIFFEREDDARAAGYLPGDAP
jgi:endonuclease YncB( thermonuclease family)